MNTRVKIRGIYGTALTKLLSDAGFEVVDPSAKMRERFGFEPADGPCDLFIQDRDNLQGVEISGAPERVSQFLTFLQERLLDATLRDLQEVETNESMVKAWVEFPGASKDLLDGLRLKVVPTLKHHHRLRIIDIKVLEQAETALGKNPGSREALEGDLYREFILIPMEKQGVVKLEHVRPAGRQMRPREGVLIETGNGRVTFRRQFFKGRYDGLDLPITSGDYGVTVVEEGSWVVKHSYYHKDGAHIGDYYNINTPVELYPYGARYLDLEVDVIRRAGEAPVMIDREKLSLLTRKGSIGYPLEEKAVAVAEGVMKTINR